MKRFALIGLLFLVGCGGGGGDSAGVGITTVPTVTAPLEQVRLTKPLNARFVVFIGADRVIILGEIKNFGDKPVCSVKVTTTSKDEFENILIVDSSSFITGTPMLHPDSRLPFDTVDSSCLSPGEVAGFKIENLSIDKPGGLLKIPTTIDHSISWSDANISQIDVTASHVIALNVTGPRDLHGSLGFATFGYSGAIQNNHPSKTISNIIVTFVSLKNGKVVDVSFAHLRDMVSPGGSQAFSTIMRDKVADSNEFYYKITYAIEGENGQHSSS